MHEGKRLDVTIFQPSNKNRWIILYLHGNSSSKLEAISIISYLPFKFALAAFDFLGCGHNKESDTISLGYRQSQQAETVAGFLKEMGYQVVLWGRSMGAASALKYGGAPIIVADSSFSRFSSLCKQIAKKNAPTYIPNFLISCLFPCVFCKLRNDV